jgi:hypothetical protein
MANKISKPVGTCEAKISLSKIAAAYGQIARTVFQTADALDALSESDTGRIIDTDKEVGDLWLKALEALSDLSVSISSKSYEATQNAAWFKKNAPF